MYISIHLCHSMFSSTKTFINWFYIFMQLLSVTLCTEKIKQCSYLLHHYIVDHRYVDNNAQDILNAGEPEKILEISEFSMQRLNDIAEQRTLYSSVDDIVYAHDDDSDFDEPIENSKDNLSKEANNDILIQDSRGSWQLLG